MNCQTYAFWSAFPGLQSSTAPVATVTVYCVPAARPAVESVRTVSPTVHDGLDRVTPPVIVTASSVGAWVIPSENVIAIVEVVETPVCPVVGEVAATVGGVLSIANVPLTRVVLSFAPSSTSIVTVTVAELRDGTVQVYVAGEDRPVRGPVITVEGPPVL